MKGFLSSFHFSLPFFKRLHSYGKKRSAYSAGSKPIGRCLVKKVSLRSLRCARGYLWKKCKNREDERSDGRGKEAFDSLQGAAHSGFSLDFMNKDGAKAAFGRSRMR